MPTLVDALINFLRLPREAVAPVFITILAAMTIGFAGGYLLANALTEEIVSRKKRTGFVHFVGKSYVGEDSKMVICVREDLNMSAGKAAAQVGHACVGLYRRLHKQKTGMVENWEKVGEPKVCVGVAGEKEMLHLRDVARSEGLPTFTVEGTQEAVGVRGSNAKTVMAMLGPGSVVDKVAAGLTLYDEEDNVKARKGPKSE